MGDHHLLCADATQAQSFEQLLGTQKAQMVFIDPPYNVPIDGHVCGLGAIKHREFLMASGEMSEAEYIDFLKTVFGASMARSTTYVSTGDTATNSRRLGVNVTSSKISAFGIRTTEGWARSTGRNMN